MLDGKPPWQLVIYAQGLVTHDCWLDFRGAGRDLSQLGEGGTAIGDRSMVCSMVTIIFYCWVAITLTANQWKYAV